MRPKGMTEHDEGLLEFLEDIIDTSQYREPLEELGRTVNELNEKRGEKFNRFRAVEREKNNLEGAKREAEEFLAMKKEANVYQYTLYEKYKQECSQLMEKAKEKHDQLEGDINQIKAAVNDQSIKKDSKIKEQKKLFK
jgi:structural maintenance of chromosome 4